MQNKAFDIMVEASGFAAAFGEQVVTRACLRAGLNAADITQNDLTKVLGYLETALHVFLTPEKAKKRIEAIGRELSKSGR